MKARTNHCSPKILIVGMVLFIVQLACGGVPSTDPRIPESLNYMAGQFGPLLGDLGFIPLSATQPPLITQVQSDSISGLGAIITTEQGVIDGTGVINAEVSPIKVRLYSMQMRGCEQEPLQGNFIAETIVDFGGRWTVEYSIEANEVVAATQVFEGKESGLSNLGVIDANRLLVDNSKELDRAQFEITQSALLKGKGLPDTCIVLQNRNMIDTRSKTVDKNGEWEINVPIGEKVNALRVYVKNFDNVYNEFTIDGSPPQMQWPYVEKDEKNNNCNYFEDEKHVVDCYFVAPVTGFFGYNDYYIVKHFGKPDGFHDGIDIGGSTGIAVHAVADGNVFYIQISDSNGGNVVLIDHGGWFSVYMHLSKITVNCPKPVKEDCPNPTKSQFYDIPVHVGAGEIIGKTGSTGTYSPHLHFSAFRWINSNRMTSLADNRAPSWPWAFGEALNVNPPKGVMLQISAYGETKANNTLSDDRLQNCTSDFNYWDIDWKQVRIKEYGPPDVDGDDVGTQFDLKGDDDKCATP